MRINLTSVHVDDQEKAAAFYTGILGFVKKHDFPMGEFKWLTVVPPEGPDDVELLLEPNDIPATAFAVDDIQAEYERLKGLGVVFAMEPVEEGTAIEAMLDDTCGNRIAIYQEL